MSYFFLSILSTPSPFQPQGLCTCTFLSLDHLSPFPYQFLLSHCLRLSPQRGLPWTCYWKASLLSSPSSYVPAFLLSPSYDVHLLVGLFHVDPPPTLSPIGAEAMPVLSAIKQPQFSTVFRVHWLSVNAHSINHQIKMFHLWNNYNSNFIF